MKSEPKRILQIIRHMNVGGAETFIMNVYRNIDREKIQFDFLVNGKGFFDDEIKQLGGNIYYIPYLTDVGQTLYKIKMKKFFNEHKEYKVIHSHLDQVSGIILEIAKKCNIPVRVSHSHSTNNSNNFIAKIYKKYLQTKINKNATHLFACSKDAAKWLFKDEFEDAIIINNGINIEKFKFSDEKRKKIRDELNINDNMIIIGHIGRFNKIKNHEFLIDIFNEYLKINDNSFLLLVGNGKLENKVKGKVKKIGIEEKVKFLGIRKDTDYLYSAFDCFIFPSLNEGLGITLIEAQASGLSTLTSENVIPKETKITNYIKYIDLNVTPKVWAENIKINRDNREKVNESLIDTEFNIKKVAEKLQKFYEEEYN